MNVFQVYFDKNNTATVKTVIAKTILDVVKEYPNCVEVAVVYENVKVIA